MGNSNTKKTYSGGMIGVKSIYENNIDVFIDYKFLITYSTSEIETIFNMYHDDNDHW